MTHRFIYSIIIFSIIAISCQKEEKQNPFEITFNRIGNLTNEIQVNQLDSIFANDSIAKKTIGNQYVSESNEIEIYDKKGARLLVLEAKKQSDPTSTIQNIQVIDSRYATPSGLSSGSVFKDIKDHYKISKINNTLSTAVIFVDSIQAYFTIDKTQLPREFQYTTDIKIEATKIPDSAKIKHFWISWNEN